MTALRRSGGLAVIAAISLLLCSAIAIASKRTQAQAAIAHRIVRDAQAELARHVHEVPDGSNNSPDIARYRTATVGAARGAPWCAYFVSYIAKKAGVPIGWHGEGMGYVPYIRDWAHKTGRWRHTPKPGYLLTFPEHVGIVEHVYSNHTLTSIEGNTSNAVLRRWHSWSDAMGYVKLADGGAVESPSAPHPQTTVVKNQKLVARIKVYPATTAAIGEQLNFSAQDSSGNITQYDWDFTGDGKWDAHGPMASHAWRAAGTYTVKLRVSDAAGHHKTATVKITVHANQPPHASLSLDSTQIHVGGRIHMDASGSTDPDGRIVKYEWDYNGDGNFQTGSSRTSHTYTAPGNYVVRVRVTDDSGNTSEADQQISVAAYDPPVASASCDQTEVQAADTLHCSSDDSQSPYRVNKHEWDLTSDGTYDLRGQSVSFSYSHPGHYTLHLRVTDVNGNTAETDVPITVDDVPPVAKISAPTTIRANTPVTFDAGGSSDSDGSITGYEWDTGSGSGYQPGGRSLTTTFTTSGAHTVKLRVTDDGGQTAETTYAFTIANTAPTARIVLPSSPYINQSLRFDGTTSSDSDGTIARYDWDLNGDGTYESTGANPTWTYTATGQYTIKLKVTDNLGATASTTAKLTVGDPSNTPPVARLTLPTGAFVNQAATISAAGSTDSDGTIQSYQWDWNGDGVIDKTTTTSSTTHTFTSPGWYQVKVTVVDNKWGMSTASGWLQVS